MKPSHDDLPVYSAEDELMRNEDRKANVYFVIIAVSFLTIDGSC